MMKYIKLKVKHILVFVFIVIALGVFININLAKIYYVIGNMSGDTNISNAYYDKIAKQFPHKKESVNGQIKKLENIINDENEHIYGRIVMSTQHGSFIAGNTRSISLESVDSINNLFEELSVYHDKTIYFDKYVIELSIINWFVGNEDKSINYLLDHNFVDGKLKQIKNIHLCAMYTELGMMKEAKEIIDKKENEIKEYQTYWDMVSNYYYLLNNKIDMFKYNEDIPIYNKKVNVLLPLQGLNKEVMLSNKSNKEHTKNIVKGKVLINGKPYKNAIVHLSSEMHSNFRDIFERGMVSITDINGEYKFSNVPNEELYIGMAIPWQRVKDKEIEMGKSTNDLIMSGNSTYCKDINIYTPLEVQVKNVGINKFKISISHEFLNFKHMNIGLSIMNDKSDVYNANYISEDIKGNEIVLDINNEKDNNFNLNFRGRNGIIDIDSLIDPLYHSGEYALWVYGSEDKDIGSISNYGIFSNKPYTTINIQGKQWTKADKLLLKGEFQKELDQYEMQLKDNPNDIHILKTLAKMYTREWDRNDDISNVDYSKALKHLLKLEKLINSDSVYDSIANCYEKNKDYINAINYYKKGEYDFYKIADCFVAMNNYDKALQYYNKEIDAGHLYRAKSVIMDMLCIYILRNSIDEIQKVTLLFQEEYDVIEHNRLIKEYKMISKEEYLPFYNMVKKGEINKSKEWLENKEDDLAYLYKGIYMILDNQTKDTALNPENYMDVYNNVKDNTIKNYMRYFGEYKISKYYFKQN